MPVTKKIHKIPQLVVQPRKAKRRYIYDYHAFILDETGAGDLFGKGGGVSIDQKIAKQKAIGEALERYCGSHVLQNLKRASYKELKNVALNPQELVYFANSQYSPQFLYKRPKPTQPIDWVEGYSLIQQKKVFVPAFAVYLGYNRLIPPEERFSPTSSCGLALHTSQEKAVLKGIFELIERDAAMIIWMSRRRIDRIDLSSTLAPELTFLRDRISDEGLKAEVGMLAIDVPIPITIGIVHDPKDRVPVVSFGLAAGEQLEDVAVKSLEEALMIRNTLELLKEEGALDSIKKQGVNNFLDHAIFYASPSRRRFWEFLLKGPQYIIEALEMKYGFKESVEYQKVETVVSLLCSKNINEVVKVDLTLPIVEKMGFEAVKVIIPAIHPMDISYNARFLGGKRLHNFVKTELEINPCPHPFA